MVARKHGHFHGNFNHRSFFSFNRVAQKTRHQQFLSENTSQWAEIYCIPEKTWAPLKALSWIVDHARLMELSADFRPDLPDLRLPWAQLLATFIHWIWSEAMHLLKLKAYGDLYRFVVLAMNGTKPLLVTQLAHSKETNYTYIHSLQVSERQKTHGTPSSILSLGAQIHCIISLVTLSGGSRLVSDIFENPMGNLCCLGSISIHLETSTHRIQFCLDSSWCTLRWAVMSSLSILDGDFPYEMMRNALSKGSTNCRLVVSCKLEYAALHGYWRLWPQSENHIKASIIYIYSIHTIYNDWHVYIQIFGYIWMYFDCSIPEMLGKHLDPGRSKVVQRFGMPKLWSRKRYDFIVYLGQEVQQIHTFKEATKRWDWKKPKWILVV